MLRWPHLGRACRLGSTLAIWFLLATACSSFEPGTQAELGDDGAGGGIGGTGIIGIVTDIEDVVVNGRTVDVAEDTLIREDGKTVAVDNLRIGQVVQIRATGPFDQLSSQSIDIRNEVTGLIDGIDWAGGVITVLGQPVTFAKAAIVDLDPNIGDKVTVSGFRLADRTIVATRIESVPSTRPAHLYGRYQIVDGTVQIEGITINGLAATPDFAGREIFAEGVLAKGGLTPTRFEIQARAPFNGLQRDLSIAGFVDTRTKTLSRTSIANLPGSVERVTLADGRSETFGVFEGRLSSDRTVLNIENQLSTPSIFGPSDRDDRDDNRPDDRPDNGSEGPAFEEKDDGTINDSSSASTDDSGSGGTDDNDSDDNASVDDDRGGDEGDTSTGPTDATTGNIVDTGIGIVDRTIDKVFGLDNFLGNKLDRINDRIKIGRDRDRDDREENDRKEAGDPANNDDGGSASTDTNEDSGGADTRSGSDNNGDESNDNDVGGNADSRDAESSANDGGGNGGGETVNDESSERNDSGRGSLGDRVRDRIDNFRDGIGGILR